jgi:uncharacterized membrane protein
MLQNALRYETHAATKNAKRVGYRTVALLGVALLAFAGIVLALVGLALGLGSEIGLGAGYAVSGGIALILAAIAWLTFNALLKRSFDRPT